LTREYYLEPSEKLAEAVKEAGLHSESFGSWFIGETVAINEEEEKD
jgi:hypothetical protein